MNTQVIGYVGENGTRDVLIPVGHLLEQWPDLSPSILMVPVGGADDDAYPVDSELVGSDLVWHVSAGDTAAIGTTKASVRMTAIDGRVALDEPFTVIVSQNLSAGGTPPSPIQPWVDKLAELAPRAEKAADDAAKAANRANDAAQNWEKGTAANASKLGGKAPEYYLTPVNLLDNSNFRIAQAGYGGYHGTTRYAADRWPVRSGASTITIGRNGGVITLDNLNPELAIVCQEVSDNALQLMPTGTPMTLAACQEGGNIATVNFVYIDPKNTGADFDSDQAWLTNGWGVDLFQAPGDERPRVRIYSNYVGSCSIKWVCLLVGAYTAETLPPYVPKPYAVELVECRRHHRPRGPRSVMYATTSDWLAGSFWFDTPMRAIPSVSNLYIAKAYNYLEPVDITDAVVNRNQNGIEAINVPGKLTAGDMYCVEAEFNADL